MIDIDAFKFGLAQSTKPGDLIQVDSRQSWNLRFEWRGGENDDNADPEQWLLNFAGDYAFTCERIENLTGQPALILCDTRLQIERETLRVISSPRGMKGWAILSAQGIGIVAEGPSDVMPRNLIIGLDGTISTLTGGSYAFAFEKWRLVTGSRENEIVVFEHDPGG